MIAKPAYPTEKHRQSYWLLLCAIFTVLITTCTSLATNRKKVVQEMATQAPTAQCITDLNAAAPTGSAEIPDHELTVSLHTTFELGNYEAWVFRHPRTGERHLIYLEKDGRRQSMEAYGKVIFAADARDNMPAYYAVMSQDLGTDQMQISLYSLEAGAKIDGEINRDVNLVWQTYLREGTVTQEEIEDFIRLEAALVPQRKVTFVVKKTSSGKPLAFMRFYDGSPFPAYYFGEHGTHLDFAVTDKRVPIEIRYPDHDFRTETDYIYEAGRLAKDDGVTDVLEKQFNSLGAYLAKKYGFKGIVPREYPRGKILIEITGRNLKKFLRPIDEGGYGFKMEYLPPIEKTGQKYVLSLSVAEFINNFYMPMKYVPPREAYPDLR